MLVVFDLAGVITSEAGYWETARAGVREIAPDCTIPQDFIYWVKNHAVNHNWDLAFVALSAYRDFEAFQKKNDHLTGKHLLAACDGFRREPWIHCHEVCQRIQDSQPPPVDLLFDPRSTFEELREAKHIFAVATGRPRAEAVAPLEHGGLLDYFDAKRIITHDDVVAAERQNPGKSFGKPNPFVIEKAMSYDIDATNTVFVGDTLSDVEAAKCAKVRSIGIVGAMPQGAFREARRRTLAAAGCRTILNSIVELPDAL